MVFVFYNGSEAEGRANFQWLFGIGTFARFFVFDNHFDHPLTNLPGHLADMTKEIPYDELNAQQVISLNSDYMTSC